ncbi:alpha-1,4-N-acetylglucosaminyltransferase-like [Anomaloglossus baeobatrachus]|uniref:alpha-1,4-N-acetylglucosaminyltransferase-like n=1 Tax=Anomaloglossus baeobatrachus TaxID=238106 RepID=UPI003F4FA6F1
MWRQQRILTIVLFIVTISFFTRNLIKEKGKYIQDSIIQNARASRSSIAENAANHNINPTLNYDNVLLRNVLQKGNNIFFIETTDRMNEPALVLCSIESAARVYPDRTVVFFMEGLGDIITEDDEKKVREHYPTLSSYKNIFFLPLKLEKLFAETPFMAWYEKIDPTKEIYWTHVKSDACRIAMIWKYGGIYMDTDVISIRPIPEDHFLAAATLTRISNGVFGLSIHHKLLWEFMENFVQNYKGEVWAHQGPVVFTRVTNKHCGVPKFTSIDHGKCENIFYFHPERFYPIFYPSWKKYYEVWENLPTFNNSYGLHLWNFMNKETKFMVVGSNTLVEHLYQQHCPSTYEGILKNKTTLY